MSLKKIVGIALIVALLTMISAPIAAADVVDDMFKKHKLLQKMFDKIGGPIGLLIGLALSIVVIILLLNALSENPQTKEELARSLWGLIERIAIAISWRGAILVSIGIVLSIWGYTFF